MPLKFRDTQTAETVSIADVKSDLTSVKQRKIQELSAKTKETIIYGFTATNGNPYRLTIEDQLNMQGQKSALDSDSTITEVSWITMADITVTHTVDEWIAVYKEAFDHKNANIFKNKQLRDKVNAATTEAEVAAVTWS